MDLKFHVFEKPGKQHTVDALNIAKENAEILGIKDILVASTSGYTAEQAVKIFSPNEYNIVIITHNYGFRKGVEQEFDAELRVKLVNQGVTIFSGTHAYSGIGPALQKEWGYMTFSGVFAKSLRKILSDGVKVCHEIAMMAADSGLVKLGTDVISIGGTGRGADTVCLVTANSTREFLKTRIKAILAKPF
jgi:hypothetical protein